MQNILSSLCSTVLNYVYNKKSHNATGAGGCWFDGLGSFVVGHYLQFFLLDKKLSYINLF